MSASTMSHIGSMSSSARGGHIFHLPLSPILVLHIVSQHNTSNPTVGWKPVFKYIAFDLACDRTNNERDVFRLYSFAVRTSGGRLPACSNPAFGEKFIQTISPRAGMYAFFFPTIAQKQRALSRTWKHQANSQGRSASAWHGYPPSTCSVVSRPGAG